MPHVIPGPQDPLQDFAKFTYDTWRDLDNTYAFWIQRWKRTIEYLRSQHWNALKQYDTDSLPEWKRFPVINYCLAFYADYMSDFLKSEIRWSALPASPDPSDLESAELMEQLNRYLWDKLDLNDKRIQLAAWLLACGVGYLRVFWNTNTGKLLPLAIPGPQGQLIAIDPETGTPMPGMEPVKVDQGEIGVEVVSPQYVRHAAAPGHGVMIGLLLTREEAKAMYGGQAEELNYTSTYEDFDANLHTIETPTTTPAKDERALVIQHYIPRSATHPDGLWWTSAQSDKLLAGPWPLPGGEVPVVSFKWIPVPGNPNMGISPLYDITFSNKLYDEIVARVLEWINKMKPKILLKAGGGLTYGDINEQPYQELAVNPGGEPEFMEVKSVPDTFYKAMQDAQNDMLTVAGYSLGKRTGQQSLGQGESQKTWRTPSEPVEMGPSALAIMNSKASWEKLGRLMPSYAAAFYAEPRVIGVQGKDRMYQWREFIGTIDLKDISATIRVDEISLYPWSRASLRDSVYSVLDSSFGQMLFMNEDGSPNMDRLNAAMNATGIDVSIPSLDPDVTEARNENMDFKEGRPVQEPQFWQHHGKHLDEHERILKSAEFKGWQSDRQQAFIQHVQQTSQMMNEAAQQEQQAMIDMERALREVRETAELQKDIKAMIAEAVVDSVREAIAAEIPTPEEKTPGGS